MPTSSIPQQPSFVVQTANRNSCVTTTLRREGCDTEAANACFSQLSPSQFDSVEAIAVDMSAAFVKSGNANIPFAEEKIVHDRFHVMKLATEAVDKVRRQEHRDLKKDNDTRLTGTKFL